MLNVEVIDLKSDDFSPAEAYGYDPYEAGEAINTMNNISRDQMRFRGHNRFFDDIFEEERRASYHLRDQLTELDYYEDSDEGVIESFEDIHSLRNISRANHLNFLSYKPVQKLIREERISAWGYNSNQLPDEDIVGRMINNGRSTVDDKGNTYKRVFRYSDDLNYTPNQLWKLERQRDLIDHVLNDTDLDPTDTSIERF